MSESALFSFSGGKDSFAIAFDITGPAPAPIACRILPKRSIFKLLAIKHTILPIRIKHIVITRTFPK